MKVKFTITDRDGKKALWADDKNIWDLTEQELTPGVKKAIISAFWIGGCLVRDEMYAAINPRNKYGYEFEEK
jgi:hypothetical protein